MNPKTSPEFLRLLDELPRVPWMTRLGVVEPLAIDVPYRFAADAIEASQSISSPEREDWALDARGELTGYLSRRFSSRYDELNSIADIVRERDQQLTQLAGPKLNAALPDTPTALDAVKWDVGHALLEAAYRDCRPPKFFETLMNVYRAGHIPTGWDVDQNQLVIY